MELTKIFRLKNLSVTLEYYDSEVFVIATIKDDSDGCWYSLLRNDYESTEMATNELSKILTEDFWEESQIESEVENFCQRLHKEMTKI